MTNVSSASASASIHENTSRHLCTTRVIMEGLLHTISGANDGSHPDTFQGLAKVLEQALSVALLTSSTALSGCLFCPLASDIVRIADRIQTKIKAMRGEVTEDFSSDCRTLRELLQLIMDIHKTNPMNPPSSSFSASILDSANDVQIDRARFTNFAGNPTLDYSSPNVFIYIKQEPGIGIRGVVVLLLLGLGFLFFLLL
ncbi:hypothetical protein F5887DRAFT_958046 [Amanita rubescens]|nr:hypothetical protein F5887DRAFT_958046 [Amanita rubescens]